MDKPSSTQQEAIRMAVDDVVLTVAQIIRGTPIDAQFMILGSVIKGFYPLITFEEFKGLLPSIVVTLNPESKAKELQEAATKVDRAYDRAYRRAAAIADAEPSRVQ